METEIICFIEVIHFNRELYVFEIPDSSEIKSTACNICDLEHKCRDRVFGKDPIISICNELDTLGSFNSVGYNSTIKKLSLFRLVKKLII